MSLLSNQQGRPASVRARPPSRSPKGLSLAGQTILVTGCNSGIGQETCRVLALRGALVLGTARTKGEGCGCVRDASRLSDMRPQVFQECNEIGCDTGHQHPATRGDLK